MRTGQNLPRRAHEKAIFYCFCLSTVVVLVVLCVAGTGVPSGLVVGGVTCFVSLLEVVVRSVVVGCGLLLGATTVVGGVC